MRDILTNALIIGGVLPMIFFGVFNVFYKPVAANISTGSLVLGVALGGLLVALGYDTFFGGRMIPSEISSKHFLLGIGGGLLWGAAVVCLGFAFEKLNANASQVIPIVNANSLITVLLALIVLQEQVIAWKVITGTILIILGTFFLV